MIWDRSLHPTTTSVTATGTAKPNPESAFYFRPDDLEAGKLARFEISTKQIKHYTFTTNTGDSVSDSEIRAVVGVLLFTLESEQSYIYAFDPRLAATIDDRDSIR